MICTWLSGDDSCNYSFHKRTYVLGVRGNHLLRIIIDDAKIAEISNVFVSYLSLFCSCQ